jgi:hypothetical protein
MYPGDAASKLSTSQDSSLHLFLPSGTFHKQEEILNFSNNSRYAAGRTTEKSSFYC